MCVFERLVVTFSAESVHYTWNDSSFLESHPGPAWTCFSSLIPCLCPSITFFPNPWSSVCSGTSQVYSYMVSLRGWFHFNIQVVTSSRRLSTVTIYEMPPPAPNTVILIPCILTSELIYLFDDYPNHLSVYQVFIAAGKTFRMLICASKKFLSPAF